MKNIRPLFTPFHSRVKAFGPTSLAFTLFFSYVRHGLNTIPSCISQQELVLSCSEKSTYDPKISSWVQMKVHHLSSR